MVVILTPIILMVVGIPGILPGDSSRDLFIPDRWAVGLVTNNLSKRSPKNHPKGHELNCQVIVFFFKRVESELFFFKQDT